MTTSTSTSDYFARKPTYSRTRSGLTPSERPSPSATASPRTPIYNRSLSQYGSPTSYRVEDESVVYSFGARSIQVGIPGESAPRCIQTFGPDQSRRVDDFRPWTSSANKSLHRHPATSDSTLDWAQEWELWSLHVRHLDLGLVEDKIERTIRAAHTNHLLLDQRSRRAVLALPTGLSNPLLHVILRTIFASTAPTSISIWTHPLLHTVSAGLRSALVVDIGWEECTVTAVYEYRNVSTRRSIRAAKTLTRSVAHTLEEHTGPAGAREQICFETAQDITERMAWCRMSKSEGDQDEDNSNDNTPMQVPIKTISGLSTNLRLPFASLADPVERTFFDMETSVEQIDNHVLPLHVLIYTSLLAIPLDVRAICMSRIVITGGVSNIPGLKPRLLSEVARLVEEGAWDPVMNYGSAANLGTGTGGLKSPTSSLPIREKPPDGHVRVSPSTVSVLARDVGEKDEISEKLAREAAKRDRGVRGVIRGVETMGAWAGASLLTSLKVEGTLEVKRDEFLKHGLASLGGRLDAI